MPDEAVLTGTATLLDIALDYLHRGWPVFPVCTPVPGKEGWCEQHREHAAENERRAKSGRMQLAKPGKHPLVSWGEFQHRLPTEDEVIAWWTRFPTANIGMVTGTLSGLVVLDADGLEAYTGVLSRGSVEPTPVAATGSPNHYHWYLRHPGRPVKNFAGDRGTIGLDFRGDGGYVVLPPSLHQSGNLYTWLQNTEHIPPRVVPLWLLHMLSDGSSPQPRDGVDGESQRGPIDIEGVLRGVPEGQRDDTLYRTACRLRSDNVPIEYAELLIRTAAANCSPPFPASGAVDKVREAYRKFPPTIVLGSGGGGAERAAPFLDNWEFKAENAADFLSRDIPQLGWLVEGLVREKAFGFFFGPPGALKTYIATDLSLALAMGSEWLGRQATQTRVLIVEEDTIEADFQQTYLRPMVDGRRIDRANLSGWLWVSPESGLKLDMPERAAKLSEWCEANRPGFILLDAFYLLHSTDGMTGRDLRAVIDVCRQIRSAYNCTVLLIDHARKAAGSGRNDEESGLDRLYGAVEKASASDIALYAQPVKGDEGAAYLRFEKIRGKSKPKPLLVRFNGSTISIEGSDRDSREGSIESIYQWLVTQGGSKTKRQIADGVGISPRSVDRALGDLIRDGRIQRLGKQGHADTWGLEGRATDENGWPI